MVPLLRTHRLLLAVIHRLDKQTLFLSPLLLVELALPNQIDDVALHLLLHIVPRILDRIRKPKQNRIPNLNEEDLALVLPLLATTRRFPLRRNLAVDAVDRLALLYPAPLLLLYPVVTRVRNPRIVVLLLQEGEVCLDLPAVRLPTRSEATQSRVVVLLTRQERVGVIDQNLRRRGRRRKETNDLEVQIQRVQTDLTTRKQRSQLP